MAAAFASIAPGVIGTGIGLYEALHGGKMYRKGLDMYQNTPFPDYTIPQEISSNQDLATRMAMTGMPSAQYAAALNNIGSSEAGAYSALRKRGDVGDINAIQSSSDAAKLNLDATSANMRRENIGQMMSANQAMAQYRDKAYQVNKLQRYLMRMGMASSLMGYGNQNVNQGLNTIGSGLMSASEGMMGQGGMGGGGNVPRGTTNPYISENLPELNSLPMQLPMSGDMALASAPDMSSMAALFGAF